jgi:beta-glucosidase
MARLGDRLDSVATFNEPWCIVWLSHLYGIHAPGERNMEAALAAMHHINLAHGLGVEAIRAEAPKVPVGLVLNAASIIAGSDSEADTAAAERAHQFHNGAFFDPVFNGSYPEQFLQSLGDRMPVVEDGDLKLINQKLDWWGLNYYKPDRVFDDATKAGDFPWTTEAPPVSDKKTDIGWEIYAPGLKLLVEDLNRRYDLPECYITENGAAYNMGVVNGEVDDQPRLDYYIEHLGIVADLIKDGYPMRGYFAWSLMDNFEWAEGYRMRFGLVHVDYETQVRTVKKSGKWYRELARLFPKGNHKAG